MIELMPLHEALVGELRDLYGAEQRLSTCLSRMAQTVRSSAMREMVARLLNDTGHQLERLEESFVLLDEDVTSRRSLGMTRILDGGKSPRASARRGASDTGILAAVRGATHFLSAVHSTAAARARALGYYDVAHLLDTSVDEARAAGRDLASFPAAGPGPAASAAAPA